MNIASGVLPVAGVLAVILLQPHLANAHGYDKCTTEPRASWKTQPEAEAAAKAAGYEVRKSKVEGTCYEVYATKDGKNFELFYNPATMELMKTQDD